MHQPKPAEPEPKRRQRLSNNHPRLSGQFWMIRRFTSARIVPANAVGKGKNSLGSRPLLCQEIFLPQREFAQKMVTSQSVRVYAPRWVTRSAASIKVSLRSARTRTWGSCRRPIRSRPCGCGRRPSSSSDRARSSRALPPARRTRRATRNSGSGVIRTGIERLGTPVGRRVSRRCRSRSREALDSRCDPRIVARRPSGTPHGREASPLR